MKKTFIYSLMLISYFCYSQEDKVNVIANKFPIYEGVINYPDKSKKELYVLLKEWIALRYNSAQDVIQMDDPEVGKIIVKGCSSYDLTSNVSLVGEVVYPNKSYHTLIIDIKENRFKYKIEITEVESGTVNMKMMQTYLLPETPVKPNGKPYKGNTLENLLFEKKRQIDKIELQINSIINDLKTLKTSDKTDW